MLKKVVTLLNVGLLRNGTPIPAEFERMTLIYGQNGRGKSTVASVLKAVGTTDAAKVIGGQTIDSDDPPSLHLVFADAQGNNAVSLQGGKWTGTPPEIFVFDPTFVDENVYSGQEVLADQRQALIKFALGADSVKLEREISQLVTQIAEAGKVQTAAEKRVKAFAGQVAVKEFVGLQDVADADQQLAEHRSKLEAARNAGALAQRQPPELLPTVDLDVEAFFSILRSTFSGITAEARETVQKHFDHHQSPAGIEEWVVRGREFGVTHGCPFCGQSASTSTLLSAYDTYFNRAYDEYMVKVGTLSRGVAQRFAEGKVSELEATLKSNDSRIQAWKDQIQIVHPSLDLEVFKGALELLRKTAGDLATRKQRRPMEPVGSPEEQLLIVNSLELIDRVLKRYNDETSGISIKITAFNRELIREPAGSLQAKIVKLETVLKRRTPEAAAAVLDLAKTDVQKKSLEDAKKNKRAELDALLPTTLSLYQERINTLLKRFDAGFKITELKADYSGGPLRSQFGLEVRSRPVKLGKRGDLGPSFSNMLSEADKRTLALAFFLARLQGFPDGLEGKIAVFDDPVASLDSNRRERTIGVILETYASGAQVVVLSHDPQFLYAIRERVSRAPHSGSAGVHEIKRVKQDYSAFADWDIERECESDYYKRHRNVREFVEGDFKGSRTEVEYDVRVMLEGFFKQRFPPPILASHANLGAIVKAIAEAPADSPLLLAQPCLEKLTEINEFVKKFHHDDGGGIHVISNDAELMLHARMALEVIYGDVT